MTKKLLVIIYTLATLMAGCAKVQVSQDYATDYQFSKFGNYSWDVERFKEDSGLLSQDELLAGRFKRSIEIVLANRGYRLSSDPELLVSCSYTVSQMLRSAPINTGYEFGYGRYDRYGTIGINSGTSVHQYQQGMLVIRIHAVRTGQLVWKGVGTREVYTHVRPEEISRIVHEMVAAVLKQFPPNN